METLKKQAAKLLGEQKKYRRWLAVFLCLAIVVTGGTTAALKMNGQALSHEKKVLACSEEVHVHTAECYESGIIPVLVEGENALDREQPICGYADYVVHAHGDGCFDEDGTLVCQIPEREAHVHTADCFEKQMVLLCGQEETEIHQHTEDCRELICGQEETEAQGHQHGEECKVLICGQEESEGHHHTEECLTVTQGELICENTEEGHEHTEECYEQIENVTCGMEESEGHTHTDECYDMQACGQEEGVAGHTHTEECYGPYTCGFGEGTEGHVHTDECYQVKEVAICGELELHTHTEECYDAEGSLICGIPELKEHVHGDECFEIIQVEDEDSTKLYQKVYEDANVRVTAEYMADANIPEEAELVAERVDASAGSAEENTAEGAEAGTEGTDESTEPAGEINEVAEVHEPEASESGAGAQKADTTGSNTDVQATESSETGSEASEAQVDDAAADGSQDVSAAEDASAAKTKIEVIEEKVTYKLRFIVDGTEIEPEGTVSFIVQGLDGEGNETGDLVTLVYKAGDGMDAMAVTLTLTKAISEETGEQNGQKVEGNGENQLFQKVYEDAEIRVTAEYAEDANIPKNAQLVAEKLETDTQAAEESAETVNEGAAQKFTEIRSDVDAQEAESGESKENVGDNETVEPIGSEEETDQDNSTDNGGVATSVEIVREEVSYRLKFLVNGAEVEPEGTVTFAGQGLDEEGKEVGEATTLVYSAGDGLETMTITLTREVTVEVQHEFRQVAEDGNVRVIVDYDSDANIPEEAVLQVEQIIADENAEHYLELESAYLEQAGINARLDILFTVGFYVGDEAIVAEAPVTMKIQMLGTDYEAGDKVNVFRFDEREIEKISASAVVASEDGSRSTSFKTDSFSTYMIGKGETSVLRKECKNDVLNIIVVAEYDLEAEIPEEAELKVEEITPETDPEYYSQREAEYLEQAGEGATMDMLLNIGFYIGNMEIEPKAPVTITIQMLDDKYQEGEQMNVVHFGDEATEKLEASNIETNEEGNKTTSFETNSFSTYALGTTGAVGSLASGMEYMIYNGDYVLTHKDGKLEAVKFSIDSDSLVTLPAGYSEEDLLWEYTVSSNNYSQQGYLGYEGGKLYYDNKWAVNNIGTNLTIGTGNTHTIKANNRYLRLSNGILSASSNQSTRWTFTTLEEIEIKEDPLKTTITLHRYNPIDDSYNPGVKNLVKIQFDLLDVGGNRVISNVSEFPEGSTVPQEYTFEVGPQGVLNIDAAMLAEMGLSIPGYTYENGWAFFWWGGNGLGAMNNVPTLRNFGEVSGKYTGWNNIGYQINPPKEPITGKGDDYVYDLLKKAYDVGFNRDIFNASDDYTTQYNPNINDTDNWVAYNPTGTLHIVLVKATGEKGYKVNFVDAYRAEEDDFSKYKQVDQLDMQMSKGEWDPASSSFDWTGNIDQLTDKVPPARVGYDFIGWSTEKDDKGNGTAETLVSFTNDTVSVKDKEGEWTTISKSTDLNQTGNRADRYYYARWERINDKYTIVKAWNEDTVRPLMESVKIKITRYFDGESDEEKAGDPFNAEGANIYELRSDSTPAWTIADIELPRGDDDGLHEYKYEIQEISVNGNEETAEVFDLNRSEPVNKIYTLTNVIKLDKSVSITVKKMEEDGITPIEGATFRLIQSDRDIIIGENYMSNADGIAISNSPLMAGSYKLQEKSAPESGEYLLDNTEIEFEVKETGTGDDRQMVLEIKNSEVVETSGWSYDANTKTFTLKDKKAEMSVMVKKVSDLQIDNPAEGLPGAEFIIGNGDQYLKEVSGKFDWGSKEEAKPFQTGEGGMLALPILPAGEYTLSETKAPNGYIPQKEAIPFKIMSNASNTEMILSWNPKTVYPTADFSEDEVKSTIVVINSTGYKLPETGGPGITMYTLGGFAVIAASLMYGLSMRRKKKKGGLN